MAEFYTHIGHVYGVTSPIANAGGPVKTLEQAYEMARADVGWVEAGSITPENRPDLSQLGEITYVYDEKRGELFNKFEMPNQGKDPFIADLPEMLALTHGHGKPLVVNVAATGKDRVQETVEMVREFYDKKVDAVLVNPDCPSLRKPDGSLYERTSKDPEELAALLAAIRSGNIFRPVFLRIAPPDTLADMNKVIEVVRESCVVSALFVSNTWDLTVTDIKAHSELEAWNGAGGKSGPATAFASANITKWAVAALKGSRVDVVRSCGVATGEEVDKSLQIGAIAAAGSTLFFEAHRKGEGWPEAIDRLMANSVFSGS